MLIVMSVPYLEDHRHLLLARMFVFSVTAHNSMLNEPMPVARVADFTNRLDAGPEYISEGGRADEKNCRIA